MTEIGDLLVFVSIVAVLVVAGVLLGILVAGRIDRLLAPRPAGDAADTAPQRAAEEDDRT